MQSGAIAIAAYCTNCDRRATEDAWISKRRFTPAEIDAMPIAANYTGSEKCQYEGCNMTAIEWNHYAPRSLFGEDADHWPIGPLCRMHHRTWHAGLDGRLMKTCPTCHQPISATAIVDAFCEPSDWLFWGTPGERWIVCRGSAHVHFRATVAGRMQHRLAIIRGEAGAWLATEQAAAETNRANGLSRNQANTPDYDGYAKAAQGGGDWL